MVSTYYNFNDRFGANGNIGTISYTEAQDLDDQTLELASAELKQLADIVRRHSVLLTNTSTLNIFNIITTQSDPRIGLYIAAAKKREDNSPLFSGLSSVQQIMFGDVNPNSNPNRSLFSDGIRNVCAKLTASILIGQLSQIKEQFEHSSALEKQALADLQQIIETYELRQEETQSVDKDTTGALNNIALYFEPLELTGDLVVQYFSPTLLGTRTWVNVGFLETDSLVNPAIENNSSFDSTWEVVVAIVDKINTLTLQENPTTGLIAAANLASSNLLHSISLYPRNYIAGIAAEVMNFRIYDPVTKLSPFKWGPDPEFLANYPVNGAMIVLSGNKASTVTADETKDKDRIPTVLYFRRKPTATSTPSTSLLRFRVLPILDEITEININRLIGGTPEEQDYLDASRYSQVAVELLNSLASQKGDTRALGALIRNDNYEDNLPVAALELIPWSITNPEAYLVLDILEIPNDLEMATGDLTKPITPFSSNPRSVRVESRYNLDLGGVKTSANSISLPQVFSRKLRETSLYKSISEEAETLANYNW